MERLLKLRCDGPGCAERADPDLETIDDAIEEGWNFLRNADGEWDYCSIECLKEHL